MNTAPYYIALTGCDDETVLRLDLTEAEAAAVGRVFAALTERSAHGCQPKAYLKPWDTVDAWERENADPGHTPETSDLSPAP